MEVFETLGVVGYMLVEVGDMMVCSTMYWDFYMKSWDDASKLHSKYGLNGGFPWLYTALTCWLYDNSASAHSDGE